jgi:23S rRNA pseudouridine1911/1915/1917 synthase
MSGPGTPGSVTVAPELAGATLAALVRAHLAPGISWRAARELCARGRVLVGGVAAVDPALRPAVGSVVTLLPERRRAPPGDPGATDGASGPGGGAGPGGAPELMVYSDADLVVVRKAAGVLTVPFDRGDRDTLLALARVAVRRREPGRGPTLRAVQRLDRDTSGLVVFARSVAAQRALQEQLRVHRAVTRRYLAIAHGAAGDATFDTLLVLDRGDGLRGSWGVWRPARGGAPPPAARRAVTRVAVRERLADATLVACELETGRQHQVRIHLAEAGHPLVGETVYIRDYGARLLPAPRLMLHAAALGFSHPRTGQALLFEEPPPPDFEAVLARLRRRRGMGAGR